MTPEVMEKVFDPFFTTKEQGKGTGLGLSTVLGITRRHGGFVTVKSEIGAGTRVTMYIPAESLPPSPRAVEQRPALSKEHGNLVLVVDDEAGVLKMTKALLTAHGYQVLTAANGSEAVALYREHQARISVVMTDMMMPVMDGEATIRALRALDPKVTVIAVSGLGNEQVLELGDADRISFLSKPYTPDKLLALLKHILGQSVPARE
jgi:CheY-like chemotaxis protein